MIVPHALARLMERESFAEIVARLQPEDQPTAFIAYATASLEKAE